MTAMVECAVCGARLYFDTYRGAMPEYAGWVEEEDTRPSWAVDGLVFPDNGRPRLVPVCLDCVKKHTDWLVKHDGVERRVYPI